MCSEYVKFVWTFCNAFFSRDHQIQLFISLSPKEYGRTTDGLGARRREPTLTLVTPGAAALASFNASNDVECARDPALIETAIKSSSFTSKAKRDDEKRIAEGKTGDAVKRAQLRARARVAEEKRKVESRLAKKNWDDTTTSTVPERVEREDSFERPKQRQDGERPKSKMKNGLEMVSHVMIPYETTKENRDTIQKNGIDIGATCICSLPNSLSVASAVAKRMRGYRVREGRVERTKEDESVCAAAKVRDE